MKPYPAYKTSGVPWLGEVPRHWDVLRLKEVSKVTPSNVDKLTVEGQNPVRLCNYVDVYKNERITSGIEFMRATATSEQVERLALKVGDVVVTKDSESPWDIAVPTVVADAIETLVCGYHLAKLEPTDIEGRFLAWALRAYQVNLHFALSAGGITRYGLSSSSLADGNLPRPPNDEQQSIADYLDAETARIDELLREKGGLIGLLREHRQGVASDAVVRGLRRDCSVKVVEGGFGSIPTHWRLVPLKRFVRVSGGHTPATDNPAYWDGAMPWVSPKDMKREELSDSIDHVTNAAVDDCGLTVVAPGATLVVVRGMILAHSFPVARNLVPVTINQDMKAIRPERDVLPEYLPWLLRGVTPVVLSLTEQSAHGTLALRTDKVFGEALPIPPASEQAEIVAFLQTELPKIDDLIAHTKDEILLLKELRAATIAEAVLGRIDLRTASAAGKPAESNNPSV